MDINVDLLQCFIYFLIKKTVSGIKNESISNEEVAEELHKPIIRKFNKRKVHSPFIDNIWGVDLADMQLIGIFNKGFSEFHSRSIKSWLEKKMIQKSVVAERFIRTLKNKIYKYMTSVSKKVCIDKSDDIVNKCNNRDHSTIEMRPVGGKSNTYIDSTEEINYKSPKFKIGDNVRISKYKNIFAKGYTSYWSEGVFMIKKVKNRVLWRYIISDLSGEEIAGAFYENELQKASQKEFRIGKVIKRKGDKLYVKCKG